MNYHYVIISEIGVCEAASTTQYRRHSPPANVEAALICRKTGTGATRAIKSAKTGMTKPHSTSPPQKIPASCPENSSSQDRCAAPPANHRDARNATSTTSSAARNRRAAPSAPETFALIPRG